MPPPLGKDINDQACVGQPAIKYDHSKVEKLVWWRHSKVEQQVWWRHSSWWC